MLVARSLQLHSPPGFLWRGSETGVNRVPMHSKFSWESRPNHKWQTQPTDQRREG